MGCGGGKEVGPDYRDEAGPHGAFADAPPLLVVTGHKDHLYNGCWTRGPMPWNGKAMYQNSSGRFLYYYAANDGGAAGWAFDHRDQPGGMGSNDWYSGGFFAIEHGPAYPPIGSGLDLTFDENGEVDGENSTDTEGGPGDEKVNIFEPEPSVPPPSLSIANHPDDDANDLYILQAGLWNGRPHYASRKGWCWYYYAANEGGEPGWALHPENVPGGAKDECDGGWVGPFHWSHPPKGDELGFNGIGRCAVTHLSETIGGDANLAASLHAMMVQERQALMASFGGGVASATPVSAVMNQPMQMLQQTTTTTTTVMAQSMMAHAQPMIAQPMQVVPSATAVVMGQPMDA